MIEEQAAWNEWNNDFFFQAEDGIRDEIGLAACVRETCGLCTTFGICENFRAHASVLHFLLPRHVCVVHRTASHCTQVSSCPPMRDCHKHPRSQLRQSCPRKHLCQCAKKLGRADSLQTILGQLHLTHTLWIKCTSDMAATSRL